MTKKDVNGDGAVAVRPGAQAAAGGGVVIGGSVHGGLIVTGDRNVVNDATDRPGYPQHSPIAARQSAPTRWKWLGKTAVSSCHCSSTLQERREP